MNEKFDKIAAVCENGISLTLMDHGRHQQRYRRDLAIHLQDINASERFKVEDDVVAEIIRTKRLVILDMDIDWRSTRTIYHYDVDLAIDRAYELMKQLGKIA